MAMKEFDKRMNVLNGGKKEIVDFILSGQFDNVIDLGCGQCVIEKALVAGGFTGHMICVDVVEPVLVGPEKALKDKIHFIKKDLALIDTISDKLRLAGKTCFILSAVLHELGGAIRDKVSVILRDISKAGDVMLIREPYHDDVIQAGNISAVIDEACQIWSGKEGRKLESYLLAPKKAATIIPNHIGIINYAFLRFYGKSAGTWDREVHEGRYTFSKTDLYAFVENSCFSIKDISFEKDSGYAGLKLGTLNVFDILRYTSCLFVAERRE